MTSQRDFGISKCFSVGFSVMFVFFCGLVMGVLILREGAQTEKDGLSNNGEGTRDWRMALRGGRTCP